MYSFLLALIYLAFISLGLPDSLLGAGWPVMHTELGVSVSFMGIISMVISGGTIVSSLLSDKLTHKFGTRAVTVTSVLLTVAALFGFSFSGSFSMLIIFAVPYGLGAGAIDAALNNYVALHYKAKHMSWLHCFWGVGAIISPFIMSFALKNLNWNSGYRIVGFIQLAIALLLLVTLPVWKINKTESTADTKRVGLTAALKIKGVPFLLIGFFAYCAAEATAMYWASTYFTEVKGISGDRAASFAALFYIGITLGRFASGFITERLGDRRMILLGTGILACGIMILLIPVQSYMTAFAAFLVIGFGCAPIYPCIIHSTPANFGAENSGAIIGIQMASAYVGSTFIPPLFGLFGNAVGFSVMPVYLLAFFALMIIMTEATFRITGKPGGKN
jgi:fucose permease